MESLFTADGNQNIINRINKLKPTSLSHWGKMTVDQMMSHCIGPLDVVYGDLHLKMNPIMALLGRYVIKGKLLKAAQFQKDSPTAPAFIRKGSYDFEATRAELIEKVQKFTQGPQVIKTNKHPFFGPMTNEEWDNLQWKHLDHHLRQFGV
ncbi:hypothetical protein FLJC2902T_13890 [Flavobacterium limnosediminis JC2902]|uniref:DUF1569 domain-containing protein n=1 Tax=Flavobacterium limnosediminis JC2902 TaxID=1341181 RepID=V6SRI2_9FLAO|nr:DUF1569 domain-containing protein [Flavobacterium limnosediminis]ESU28792.1 hypothetical protein FLJC2902T_13890 [Flavobacterium limnosediminis JC2902]